jgi:hypothetical protein
LLLNVFHIKAQSVFLNPLDQYVFLCGSNSIDIQLDPNIVGNSDVVFLSDAEVDWNPSTLTYAPYPSSNPPKLNFSIQGLLNYRGYGYIEFEVRNTKERFRIYLINCCQQPIGNYSVLIDDVVSTLPGFPNFSGDNLYIFGDVVFDASVSFDNSQLFFGIDAKVDLVEGIQLNIANNTELVPYCDYRWDGIIGTGPSTEIIISNSYMTGASRGFFLNDEVSFYTEFSNYQDNVISHSFDNYRNGGPFFYGSLVEIKGNQYHYPLLTSLPFHPSSGLEHFIFPNIIFGSYQFAHILVRNSDWLCIGVEGEAEEKNNFSGRNAAHILSSEATFAIVNNNFFETSGAIIAVSSNLEIGGTPARSNSFTEAGSEITDCAALIAYNSFLEASGISIASPVQYGIINSSAFGIHAHNNEVVENSFVAVYGTNQNYVDVLIEQNNFGNGRLICEDLLTQNVGLGVRIIDNGFDSNEAYYAFKNSLQVSIVNCPGIRIGHNTFELYVSNTTLNFPYVIDALNIISSPNAEVKDNFFHRRAHALILEGDISGIDVNCNHFYHNDYGIFNYNVTNPSPTLGTSSAPLNNTFETDPAMSAHLPIISLGGSGTPNQIAYTFSTAQPLADPNQGFSIFPNYTFFSTPFSSSSPSAFCSILTKKPLASAKILLFPNPTTDFIFIEGAESSSVFQIYNLVGELLIQTTGKQKVEVSLLPAGQYLLHIIDLDGKSWSQKFIKL